MIVKILSEDNVRAPYPRHRFVVLHQLPDLSIKLISTHRCMNIPFVGKPAIGPSLLDDDDDDDVCAVCTADLIHLEREREDARRALWPSPT